MLVTFGFTIFVQSYFIHRIPCFIRQYLFFIFYCDGNVCVWVNIYCLHSVDKDRALQAGKKIARFCMQNYSYA